MAVTDRELYLKIGRPTTQCAKCGGDLPAPGRHPSVLRQATKVKKSEEEESLRQDFCSDCWSEMSVQDYVGFWLSRREQPKVRKISNRKERNQAVLAYFQLVQARAGEPEADEILFVVAHLLMKYGAFKWIRTQDPEAEQPVIIFKQQGSDDEVAVKSVSLSDERALEIKTELDDFLAKYALPTAEQAEQAPAAIIPPEEPAAP